jgi:hypothetical protein
MDTKRVVSWVKPKPREWAQNPQVVFVEGGFADGDEFSAAVAGSTAEQAIASLQALVGQEVEITLDDQPREYNGILTWKLRRWPGKPAQPSSGRGGGGGMRDEQAALVAASILVASGLSPDKLAAVADVAREMLGILKGLVPQASSEASTSVEAPAKPAVERPADAARLPQLNALKRLAAQLGWSEQEALQVAGVDAWEALTRDRAGDLIAEWQSELDARAE